jgi:hypothetical protein
MAGRPTLPNSNYYGIQQALDRLRSVLASLGKVKVTAADTVAGYLASKLVSLPGIALTVLGPGNEQLQVAATGLSVPTVAALAALDPTAYEPGIPCNVDTLRQAFDYDPTSVLTPDGIAVIAAIGGGNWIRQTDPVLSWQQQLSWFIDGQAGDDEADGLVIGRPIRTWAELLRRIGVSQRTPAAGMAITILDDLQAGDAFVWEPVADGIITITGVRKPIFSGTVGAYSRNPATQDCGQLTASSAWTPIAGSFLEFSGTVGACVIADLGADTARVSTPVISGGTYSAPAPGTSFIAYDVPSVGGIRIHVNGELGVILREVGSPYDPGSYGDYLGGDNFVSLRNCRLENYLQLSNFGWNYMYNCATAYVYNELAIVLYAGLHGSMGSSAGGLLIFNGCPVLYDWLGFGAWLSMYDFSQSYSYFSGVDGQLAIYGQIFCYSSRLDLSDEVFGTSAGGGHAIYAYEGTMITYGAVAPRITRGANNTLTLGNAVAVQLATQIPIWDDRRKCGMLQYGSMAGGQPQSVRVGLIGAATVGTRFIQPNFTEAAAATVPVAVCRQNGILRNLRVDTSANVTGNTYAVSVMVNGVSRLTATVPVGQSTVSNTSTNYVMRVGDKITVRAVLGAGGAAADPQISFEIS